MLIRGRRVQCYPSGHSTVWDRVPYGLRNRSTGHHGLPIPCRDRSLLPNTRIRTNTSIRLPSHQTRSALLNARSPTRFPRRNLPATDVRSDRRSTTDLRPHIWAVRDTRTAATVKTGSPAPKDRMAWPPPLPRPRPTTTRHHRSIRHRSRNPDSFPSQSRTNSMAAKATTTHRTSCRHPSLTTRTEDRRATLTTATTICQRSRTCRQSRQTFRQ